MCKECEEGKRKAAEEEARRLRSPGPGYTSTPKSKGTCPKSTGTCPKSTGTCPKSKRACPKSRGTRPMTEGRVPQRGCPKPAPRPKTTSPCPRSPSKKPKSQCGDVSIIDVKAEALNYQLDELQLQFEAIEKKEQEQQFLDSLVNLYDDAFCEELQCATTFEDILNRRCALTLQLFELTSLMKRGPLSVGSELPPERRPGHVLEALSTKVQTLDSEVERHLNQELEDIDKSLEQQLDESSIY